MLKHLFVILVIVSVCALLYGVYNINLEVDTNDCQMTYMFAPPQYSKIASTNNTISSYYGLYYYNEGVMPMYVTKIQFKGAPVIFIPGNGGSYKQVRSLASVALRKGEASATKIHLDYFTVDFNEELSALFGNYLERQARYLKVCIKAVLNLYANNNATQRKVILIGHSMGALIAQAILKDSEVSKYINTIIAISSPIYEPVLNIDEQIDAFYQDINNYLETARPFYTANSDTNYCSALPQRIIQNKSDHIDPIVSSITLITIGGGNRDLLIPAGLTVSKFSDVHSMSVSIPKVWVSCDHLSSVWCLQLVLVISRYLFSICTKDKDNYVYFLNDKAKREDIALHHFVRPKNFIYNEKHIVQKMESNSIWREDARRVFSKSFKEGVKKNFIQLLPLWKYSEQHKLLLEISNMEDEDFVFGCSVKSDLNKSMSCENAASLTHYLQTLPSIARTPRSFAILDVKNLQKTYANWSHVGLYIRAARKSIAYNIDVYNPIERHLHVNIPRWYASLQETTLVKESKHGTLYYKLLIQDLDETYTTIELKIESISSKEALNPITIKMCIPWAPGFTKYKVMRHSLTETFYVNLPVRRPKRYNATTHPVTLEIFLDPSHRYHISYRFSLAATMSRIVQQYYQWLPSHLTAVVLIALRQQIRKKLHNGSNAPYSAYFQYESFFLVTACRVFLKILTQKEIIAQSHGLSMPVTVIIHSTAIVLSIIVVSLAWFLVVANASALSRIIIWRSASNVIPGMPTFSVLFAVFTNVLAIKTCGGLALFVVCIVYTSLISNGYNNYKENWTLTTALAFSKKTHYLKNSESNNHSLIRSEGMHNFSYHVTLLVLLTIMAALNVMSLVAWLKDASIIQHESDPSLLPSVIAVNSLILLWWLSSPTRETTFVFGDQVFASLVYVSASATIIYGRVSLYKLNYIIAFVFVLLLAQEILKRFWNLCIAGYKKNK